MLPLDSPRWSKLLSSVGNGVEPAKELARLKPLLLKTDSSTFAQDFDEFGYIVEDLDHQQTTYPATTAAMPHFVEMTESLPLQNQVQALSWIATMHYDGAGVRTEESDLLEWYQASIVKAKNLNESILRSGVSLDFYQQISLLESQYLFNGDYHYMFREHDWFEYGCPKCKEALVAAHHLNEFWVWRAEDGTDLDKVPADKKAQVKPTADIENSVKNPENQELKLALDLAKQGSHQATIDWLLRIMGSSPCPACGEQIRLAYNDYWFGRF